MESKKLISMLAMAAAMVGCSQEELVVDGLQNATVDLSGRPVLSEVVLGTGANSRMAIAEGSAIQAVYEEGDKIGAALFDTPKYASNPNVAVSGVDKDGKAFSTLSWKWGEYAADATKKIGGVGTAYSFAEAGADARGYYTPVDYINSNYPFACAEDGKFYTNAELVEGHYMFYLPYAENYRIREALKVVVPQIQDCSDEVMRATTKGTAQVQTSSTALSQFFAGEVEGFKGAMAVAGFQFLGKDNTRPEVSLEPLYAYPLITIKNNFNSFVYGKDAEVEATAPAKTAMVIDSIQVYYAGSAATNPLFYKASLKKEIAEVMGGTTSWWNKRFTSTGAATSQIMTATLDSDGNPVTYAKHSASAYGLPKINTSLTDDFTYVGKNHVTLVLNKELANGESYSFHAVLPAADYGYNLKARVFATINGKACVISDYVNTPVIEGTGADAEVVGYELDETETTAAIANEELTVDYAFRDEAHGNEKLVLIRGEHYPKAEFALKNAQITGLKAFCGDMMTINLASTIAEDGTVTGATAFELNETVVDTNNYYGIEDNADFIAYMTSYIQNGVAMEENVDLIDEERSEWGAGELAFAANNTVIINAELVEEIYAQVNEDNQNVVALTLNNTQLAVGADVVATSDGNTYVYSTMNTGVGAKNYSIKVVYNLPANAYGTVGTALLKGINKITDRSFATTNKTLAVKAGESNAIVELSTNAVYAGATGINAIYLTEGTLTVNSACDVMIVATGGNIVIGANGSLTNANNNIAATVPVTNNYGKQIAGTLAPGTVVSATYTQWPTTAIAQNSRINNVTVAPATNYNLPIEQAQIAMLGNLSGVTVNLGANVKAIVSANNVTLSKIAAIKAAASTPWNNISTVNAAITVSSTTGVEFNNIYEGQGTVFGSNVNHVMTPVNKAGIEAAFAAGKTVKLISNITLTEPLKVTAGQNATINLNGKSINFSNASTSAAFLVDGGKLTINGDNNSVVYADGTLVGADGKSGINAVCAKNGAEVIINGGYFQITQDINNSRNDCIYVMSNSNITINGGIFEYVGTSSSENGKDGDKFLLNCKDGNNLITVNGGMFKNHVPSISYTGAGEVVLGDNKKVYNGETEVTSPHTYGTDVWYTVK